MKKMLVVLTLAILAIGSASADGSSVTVQNQERWRFWYVLDPPGFADEEPGSPWLAVKATGFFADAEGEFPFTLLEPGASASFDGLSEGAHFLLGFFEDDSLEELPVRLIAMQADSSMQARHYDVYSLPELIMADRGEGLLARFARAEQPAAEMVEAPVSEEPVVEMAAAPAAEEPVAEAAVEAAAEEPAVEELAAEAAAEVPVAEAAAEAPVAETVVEVVVAEPAVAEPAVEAAAEVAAETAAVEPAAEPMAAEVPAAEVVVEAAVAEPATEEPAVEVVAEAALEEPAAEAPPGLAELATFSESYDPVYFTRESRDGFTVLPIASSRYWRKPGTRLAALSGSLQDGTFTLMLQSADGFAKNVSFFFYIFPVRTAGGSSTYTFEARPEAGGRAAVVLWQKGKAVPRLVGTASTDGGKFTWTASADELPEELVQTLGPAATLDLTTAWLDETAGTWEEFYFTTFAVADLTR
jgi:hypothetical protein